MTGKRIIFYILSAFLTGVFLVIYIQYKSTKNIHTLIDRNEKLLNEFKIDGALRELRRDVVYDSPGIRRADSTGFKKWEEKTFLVKSNIDQLQKISDDDSSVKYIDILDTLVQRKIFFTRQKQQAFHSGKNDTAENATAVLSEKILNDSIILMTNKINDSRQKLLEAVTLVNDKSGKKALQFSIILISLVLVSAAALFWYIINIIRKQAQLIYDLNISEMKVRESAQVKGNFLANMSHEIRTPMNAILGFTNLLQRKSLDDESKGYVQTIQKSGENLLTIINDILDLSKIEAGMMRIESAPFSIRGLLYSVETMFKGRAKEKQIQLSVFVDDAVPDTLEGDATRLTQILANLIDNSLKFTPQGNISINITNEGLHDNSIAAGITVTDSGIGIQPEKLKLIFERFQQAEDSVTRKYGGTGLGLAIVNDLVLLQNGSIKVESEYGKGTTFRLVIPYQLAAEQTSIQSLTGNSLTLQPVPVNIKILVAEDNEINQSLVTHLFKSWQLDFDIVNNGKKAVEALQAKKYNLVLMDIQMPEMDGYTATVEIRHGLKLDIPVIAMTAHALAGEREKCLSYGMNEYISKPIREEQLYSLIARFARVEMPAEPPMNHPTKIYNGTYKYINLDYMKEISGGNTDYEKTVTTQFIEAIPEDLAALEKAWRNNDITLLRQLAHNMKTTISVMGLDDLLLPYLDALEYENPAAETFQFSLSSVKVICNTALEEARRFHSTF